MGRGLHAPRRRRRGQPARRGRMKSIRLSLVVYFVVLEAAALAAASWLVYRTAEQSLQAEQKTSRELLLGKLTEARERTSQGLDGDLLNHARQLAGLVVQHL